MSTPGIILPMSWADSQAIAASSEASSELAATNLLDPQPSLPWRTTGSGTHTASGGFGQTRRCTVATLWAHNLTTADTATLELADDAGYSVNLVTHAYPGRYAMYAQDGPVGGDGEAGYQAPFVVGVFPEVSRAYWRWTIDRASGYSQIGRMMIGLGWQPAYNFDWSLNIKWVNPSIMSRTPGGQVHTALRAPYRAGTIQWSWLDEDEGNQWDDITYALAQGSCALIIPYPDQLTDPWGRRKTILAKIVDHDGPQEAEHGYTASTTIEEAL